MTRVPDDAIAVVGIAGRFPGARDPEQFWRNTLQGRCDVTRRTDAAGEVLWARGELDDDIASFDPAFFGMSSREALVLDPQHRLLLECAWEALADTALDSHEDARIRRTAVFAGANHSGYRELLHESAPGVSALEFESGTDKDFLATRIAYRLGLQGPCLTVQTACSSSLVAVHLAGQALLEYEADQALAGGVSLVLPQSPGWRYEPQGIHSLAGVCRPFDADADGTVMGDGAGMVVLRRLADAIADGGRIYAVIRGSSVNNDGARKIGYAAPSVPGQAEVIRAAHARAGVTPSEIGYVETHGTGTPLGDRVEVQALVEAFASDGPGGRCALGSVKGAIGHLDIAAGVVGLIRAALALHHAVLPGTVNHQRPSPALNLDGTPFHVLSAATSWGSDAVRRAGVSSFGVGGTNAHVVLEELRGPAARPQEGRSLAAAGYQPQRFWPSATSPAVSGAGQPVEYRRVVWREWPPAQPSAVRQEYARLVLLADRDAGGEALHDLLRTDGHEVVWTPGPVGPGDRRRLLPIPSPDGRTLVVCAYALAPDPQRARCGYDVLVALATEGLAGDRTGGGCDVVLLTRGVYPVLGGEEGDASLATLAGLARVLSMEMPAVRIRLLDLPDVSTPVLADAVRQAMAWGYEPVLARRGRRWWHPGFEPVAHPAQTFAPASAGGVSVVLGVGQIGAAAARVLARDGNTVVLATRPGAGRERAEALARELESVAAAVVVEDCDVTASGALDGLLTRLVDRFGAVDRFVLAAGISGERAYQDTAHLPSWRNEEHFRVKVDGVAALGTATERHPVRRVILMSSLAGVLGAISLGPYSAAAAAMDCYAQHFDALRTGWLSIGWDAWQHDDPSASAHEHRMVQGGLTADEADAALTQLLLSDTSGHVLVVKGDFTARWERFVRQPLHRTLEAPVPASVAEPTPDISRLLLEAWRACLAEPDLGPDDDLVEHGADSLSAIEVLADVGDRLGVELAPDLIFQAQNTRLLAARIAVLAGAQRRNHAAREAVHSWGSSGPAVWCLHPISGSADCFAPLADVLHDHRVRAVAGVPLSELTGEESIESQADRYHRLLSSDGPAAVLVGWSYGGILAFEMAQAVCRSTGRLPTVVVVDMPAPSGPGARSITEVRDAEIVAAITAHRAREMDMESTVDPARLRSSAEGEAMTYLLDGLRADGVVPPGFSAELARRLATGYRHRLRAVERYRPAPYPGPVILLRASQSEFGDTTLLDGVLPNPQHDPSWGWDGLSGLGSTTRVMDGHHATLLRPPSVHDAAEVVRHAARAARRG